MSEFRLEIITPNKKFFDGNVESLTFSVDGGSEQILANHQMTVSVVDEGEITFKTAEGEKSAYLAEGFLEVRPDETVIFTNYCDYDTDIAAAREKMKAFVEAERQLHKESISRQKRNRIMITRMLENMKLKYKKSKNI